MALYIVFITILTPFYAKADEIACSSHDECLDFCEDGELKPFCYHIGNLVVDGEAVGECSSCDECHGCGDGIDQTCGYCGDGYPTIYPGNCSYPSISTVDCSTVWVYVVEVLIYVCLCCCVCACCVAIYKRCTRSNDSQIATVSTQHQMNVNSSSNMPSGAPTTDAGGKEAGVEMTGDHGGGFNASINSAPPLYDDVAPDAPPLYDDVAPDAPPPASLGMQQPAVYQQPQAGGPQPVMYQQQAAQPQPAVYQQQQPPAQQVVYQPHQQQPVQQVVYVYQQPVNAGHPAASNPQPQVVDVMQPQTDGGPPGSVVSQQPIHGAPQPVVYQQPGPVGAPVVDVTVDGQDTN